MDREFRDNLVTFFLTATFGQDKNQTPSSPVLIPYPNWNANLRDAKNLTSVVKVRSDPCDRLWVLDTGVVEGKMESPPSLQVFDLRQDVQIRYTLFITDIYLIYYCNLQVLGLLCGKMSRYGILCTLFMTVIYLHFAVDDGILSNAVVLEAGCIVLVYTFKV